MSTIRKQNLGLLLALVGLLPLALLATGCPPPFPQCDKNEHCVDNGPEGNTLMVCCNNQCQECCSDPDCKSADRPRCKENRCVECMQDSDCKPEKPVCESEKCVYECEIDADCARRGKDGMICKEHKCQWECETDADCQEGFECKEHRCVVKCNCQSDADCPEGKMCRDCECVDKPLCELEVINFDFNRYELRSGDQEILDRNVECLKSRTDLVVTVEGHCDDRGTTDYNIQLGNKRASAALRYMEKLGIQRNRLKSISYGEERPVCNEESEDCWARNRRCEFKY